MDTNTKLVKREKLSDMQETILYFIVYSFIGWCLETFYAFMVLGRFVKRGFLFGPICPIYGFGAVLLIFNLKKIKGNNFKKFFIAMIVFSAFEFVASFILEAIFHQRWWDYSNDFMNLQGRICLAFSIVWGLVGVLFVNNIHPFIEKQVDKLLRHIPFNLQKMMLMGLLFVFLLDEMLSIVRYL